jgi:hypothetical protein
MRWRPEMRGIILAAVGLSLCGAAPQGGGKDPKNPSCPKALNWSTNPAMTFTPKKMGDRNVLLAEGVIDRSLLPRLSQVLNGKQTFDEIWFRSPGGLASVGNDAGRMIRKLGISTRIPAGWACFSACNFMFMGGPIRYVDPGGLFVVHMFTHVSDRAAVRDEIKDDADAAVDMIGDIEQSSAMLASDDNDFLIRMGVSRKLLTEVMYRQKAVAASSGDQSTRRCLTSTEVFKYNVANAQ